MIMYHAARRGALAIMLCCILGAPLLSQGRTIGLKGGLNVSRIEGANAGDSHFRTGLIGGIFLTGYLSEHFAIQPEFLYSQKGDEGTVNMYGLTFNVRTRLNYFEVPVMAKFISGDRWHFAVGFGPSFGFLKSAKLEILQGTTPEIFDISNEVSEYDYGVMVGAEIRTPANLLFEARYCLGLKELDPYPVPMDATNSTFSLMIGYLLH